MAKLPRAPRVNIEIPQEVIDIATRAHSGHCMIADAIKVAIPDATFIAVDLQTIRFTDPQKGVRYTYLTPRTGQIALCRFDEGDSTIEPFKFQLRDGQVTRSGGRNSQRKGGAPEGGNSNKGLEQAHLMNGENEHCIPTRTGGQTPPRGPLASGGKIPPAKRRNFGLRALERNGPGETLKTGTRVGNPTSEATRPQREA